MGGNGGVVGGVVVLTMTVFTVTAAAFTTSRTAGTATTCGVGIGVNDLTGTLSLGVSRTRTMTSIRGGFATSVVGTTATTGSRHTTVVSGTIVGSLGCVRDVLGSSRCHGCIVLLGTALVGHNLGWFGSVRF